MPFAAVVALGVAQHRDGSLETIRVEYPCNAPYYLSYLQDSQRRARYLRAGRAVHFRDAVLVTDVDEARNGLRVQPGDFITHVASQAVTTPTEFHTAVDRYAEKPVTLQTSDGRSITIEN